MQSKQPKVNRFLDWIKRWIERAEKPRCVSPFCGDELSEVDITTGRSTCETCEPAIYRRASPPCKPGQHQGYWKTLGAVSGPIGPGVSANQTFSRRHCKRCDQMLRSGDEPFENTIATGGGVIASGTIPILQPGESVRIKVQ